MGKKKIFEMYLVGWEGRKINDGILEPTKKVFSPK